jgi:hypothetical protein
MHLNKADIHENQCSLELAANPTNMMVIRKKHNKKSNKESKNYKKEVS